MTDLRLAAVAIARRRTALAVALTALFAVHCGDSDTIVVQNPQDAAGTPPTGTAALLFVDQSGDDGRACQADCTFLMSFNEERSLQVLYLVDGTPVANVPIRFTNVPASNTAVQLTGSVTTTGSDGVAAMKVRANASQTGQATIEASVDNNPNVPKLRFVLSVSPKGLRPLSVLVQYEGRRDIESVEVLLFKQSADNPRRCNDLDVYRPPQATILRTENRRLSAGQAFSVPFDETNFTNLENDSPQFYTMVAIGRETGGPPLAWKCIDGTDDPNKVRVASDASNSVTLLLEDLPARICPVDEAQCSYELDSFFDLVSALPDNVRTPVNRVLGFFSEPAGTILTLVCDFAGDNATFDDFCGYLFTTDPSDPRCEDNVQNCYSTLGTVAFDIIDAVFKSALEDNVGGNIFQAGEDIGLFLKQLNLQSTMQFSAEPDENGDIAPETTRETWHTIRFRLSLGEDCPVAAPSDSCGWQAWSLKSLLELNDTLVGQFAANLDDNARLSVDPHPLNIRYGALLNFIIEKVVLSLIVPDVTSYESFIGTLVGGRGCAIGDGPRGDYTQCCETFAAGLDDPGTTVYNISRSACSSIIVVAGDFLRTQLNDLDAESGDSFLVSTAQPCQLVDEDNDMIYDRMGSSGNRCEWKVDFDFGFAQSQIDAEYFGCRGESCEAQ